MNYRHIYHAGNFGDVLKHIVLIALIQSLARKETPFCFLDTHAGIGVYDLSSARAKKNLEATNGIFKLLNAEDPPNLVQDYLKCLAHFNPADFQIYPGSPAIAKYFLRPQDRIVACELHEEDFQTLKNYFRRDKQVGVHLQDGYQALKAYLPPKEKRGIILIDPPYEKHEEYETLLKALPQALERFPNGTFALWYPIKDERAATRFVASLRNRIAAPTQNIELSIYPTLTPNQLNGSGLFIVNPPFQLDATLKSTLPWIWKNLSQEKLGQWQVD